MLERPGRMFAISKTFLHWFNERQLWEQVTGDREKKRGKERKKEKEREKQRIRRTFFCERLEKSFADESFAI